MIYAAFSFWLFLIFFVGMGIYRLWAGMVRPAWLNWAMLPGTVVSEMAYIFGCLITGGEIRRAKLIDSSSPGAGKGGGAKSGSSPKGGEGPSGGPAVTEATPKFKFIGPVVASLLAIIACGAAIWLLQSHLDKSVISTFYTQLNAKDAHDEGVMARTLPKSWDGFWDQAHCQVSLLQRTCETWTDLKWTDWRVPLFVYLAACLSIRLAPARREVRAMLAAAVLIAVGILVAGMVSDRFTHFMRELWPLVTYVWASLLFLLVVTLVIRAIVTFFYILAGKTK